MKAMVNILKKARWRQLRVFNDSIDRLLGLSANAQNESTEYSFPLEAGSNQKPSENYSVYNISLKDSIDMQDLLEQINLDKRRAVTDLNL